MRSLTSARSRFAASRRFPLVALATAVSVGAVGGCTFFQSAAVSQTAGDQPAELFVGPIDARITPGQIEEMVQGFADRYSAVITSACDTLLQETSDPVVRLRIDRFQTRTISAIFDIATNEDAYTKLLDLAVVVSLTADVAIAQGFANEAFGERAEILTEPLQRAREEMDEVAKTCLRPEELVELDKLITGWRRQNPDVENVAFVRFDNFSSSRSKDVLASVRNGAGLLAPISDAVDEVTRTRLLAERAFYMAKRAPLLVSLETNSIMSQVAAMPEVQKGIAIGDDLAQSADRLTASVERLPAELDKQRDQMVGSIEKTSGMLQSTLGEYQRAIAKTDDLINSMKGLSGSGRELLQSLDSAAATLTQTITAAERVATIVAGPTGPASTSGGDVGPPEKPFDPEVYARMLVDLRGSIEELNKALVQTQSLAEGSLWEKPTAELNRISKERVEHASIEARAVVDLIYHRSLVLLATLFGLLLAYKLLATLIQRSLGGSGNTANAAPTSRTIQ